MSAIRALFTKDWYAPSVRSIRGHLCGTDVTKALITMIGVGAAAQSFLAALPDGLVPPTWAGYLTSFMAVLSALLDMFRRFHQGADIEVENVAVSPGEPPLVVITPAADQGVALMPTGTAAPDITAT